MNTGPMYADRAYCRWILMTLHIAMTYLAYMLSCSIHHLHFTQTSPRSLPLSRFLRTPIPSRPSLPLTSRKLPPSSPTPSTPCPNTFNCPSSCSTSLISRTLVSLLPHPPNPLLNYGKDFPSSQRHTCLPDSRLLSSDRSRSCPQG